MRKNPVITANMVCRKVLEDLFDSVNEGDVSIPISNAYEGLHDAANILGFVMGTVRDRRQLTRYEAAIHMSRKPKRRRV